MDEIVKGITDWAVSLGTGIVGKILQVCLIAAIGLVAIRLVDKLLERVLSKSRLENTANSLILSVAKIAMYAILILALASSLGIDITGVVALASVATLAVSLSLQNMLTNVIGGFTLLNTHPFTAGDYVEIAGQSGTVKEIGIAYTQLTTPDNRLIFIPNSSVVGAEIINYTVTGTRRLDIAVTASYDAPAQKVLDALLQAADMEKVMSDPAPFAAVTDYKDSAIEYLIRVWVPTPNFWDVKFELTRRIKTSFDENGIEMTYPHLNIHMDK